MNVKETLDIFGTKLKEDLQAELLKKGVETNAGQDSRLSANIKFYYGNSQDGDLVFYLSMPEYWQVVDEGRGAGKRMPPINPIEDWIKRKGFKVETSTKRKSQQKAIKNKKLKKGFKQISREKAVKSLAFAIAKTISKEGTMKRFNHKGADFYNPVVYDGRIEQLQIELLNQFKREVKIQLIEPPKFS